MDVPNTRYAKSGDVYVAYQVVGEGPFDLLFTQQMSNLFWVWQQPRFVRIFRRLASFSRLILLDRRGTGLSDRPRVLTLEAQADDVRAVLDATGSERAVLFGAYGGGQACVLVAAMYPQRTQALALFNTPAYGAGPPPPAIAGSAEAAPDDETLKRLAKELNPSIAGDSDYVEWFRWSHRLTASPGGHAAFDRMLDATDLRDVLPAVRVPTLILYRDEFQEEAHEVCDLIPGARSVRLPGADSGVYVGDEVVNEVERFLRGAPFVAVPESVLSTVLFTDIVGSTERTAVMGDRAWRDLLSRHNAAVRSELARFAAVEHDTAGDGFFATIDGPARAIRCAQAIVRRLDELGLQARAGVHTGECELEGAKPVGIAVAVGARVAAAAAGGEVLVSRTVRDLVAGSGINFESRGTYELKGVGELPLYAVTASDEHTLAPVVDR
jgi:class 3 adenylate cyclase